VRDDGDGTGRVLREPCFDWGSVVQQEWRGRGLRVRLCRTVQVDATVATLANPYLQCRTDRIARVEPPGQPRGEWGEQLCRCFSPVRHCGAESRFETCRIACSDCGFYISAQRRQS